MKRTLSMSPLATPLTPRISDVATDEEMDAITDTDTDTQVLIPADQRYIFFRYNF